MSRTPPSLRVAFLVACFAAALSPAYGAIQSGAIDGASDLIEEYMDTTGAPGVAVTVGTAGELVWSEGFGYADLEQRVPVWPAVSLFRVGSVAKPMTATAIGLLVESGVLNLDAPVQQYVPSFPEKNGAVTTRLLGGHLAGIRHYRGDEFLSQRHYATVIEGLDIFKNDPLLHPPGTAYSYSSYGWNLISAVIEGASDEAFLDYMQKRVFGPAGMRHTVADQVTEIIPHRGRYYELVGGHAVNSPPVDNSYKWAGGGFLSTSEDLVRFGFSYLYAEVLQPETIELLWTSQETTAGEVTGYGIGWGVGTDDEGRRYAGHTGGSVGGTTFLRIYRDEEVVVAVIANVSSGQFGSMGQQIAELFLESELVVE